MKIENEETANFMSSIRKNLQKAARARKKRTWPAFGDWNKSMKEVGMLLLMDGLMTSLRYGLWESLFDKYVTEASALLLQQAYGRECELKEARHIFKKVTREFIPCYVCLWSGEHEGGLQCKACKGKKLLPLKKITCPKCQGTGIGTDFSDFQGCGGFCSFCDIEGVETGKILIDPFNKPAVIHPLWILKLPR